MPDIPTQSISDSQNVTNATLALKIDGLKDIVEKAIREWREQHSDHEARIRLLEAGQVERNIKLENIVCDVKELKEGKADRTDVDDLHVAQRNWNIVNSMGAVIAIILAAFADIFKK